MTDPITKRRVPRTVINEAWSGAAATSADTGIGGNSLLAQHQVTLFCTGGTPSPAPTVTVWIRPPQSNGFVSVGTITPSDGTGILIFHGIFDGIQLTSSAAFGSGITAYAQLDSVGNTFGWQ